MEHLDCTSRCAAANRAFASRGLGRRLPLASVGAALAIALIGCGSSDVSSSLTTNTTTTTTTTPYPLYACHTHVSIDGARAIHKKGMCLDDTTFWQCPDKMPGSWPNVRGERVASIRLFKPWSPDWGGDEARRRAWDSVKGWLEANDGQVLLGTGVSCDSDADDQMWQWSLEMIKFLGKDRIMGVAVGNEMDVFYRWKPQKCLDELWSTRYWETLQARVDDVDKLGMTDTPITVVWAMSVMESMPWKEDRQAKVHSLVKKASKKWGKRFVWSFNVYGIWDHNLYPHKGADDCHAKVAVATHIGYTKKILQEARRRIKMTTGNDDDIMWVGENGWSSPIPGGHPRFPFCPEYDSIAAFRSVYENFLTWDLTLDHGLKGPDHAFFFTMRDSHKGMAHEHFGLIKSCKDTICKIRSPGGDAGSNSPRTNATRA